MLPFLQGKKLIKLRKLHHDKSIKLYFFALLFENDTLGTILKVVHKSPIYIFILK